MSAGSTPSRAEYRFGPFRFDATLCRLYRHDEPMALTTKAAETLLALLERVDRIVEKDELLRIVWSDVVVGEDTLAQNISTLRRVLGDDANRPRTSRSVAASSGTASALLAVRARRDARLTVARCDPTSRFSRNR